MLLRRVTEHVKDQNWFAVLLDFFIVVIGVFIGIQVANWNETRLDKQREAQYLLRLERDFEAIENRLNQSLATLDETLKSLAKIRARVQTNQPPETVDERSTFSVELLSLTRGRLPAQQSPTFVELQSAGEMNILSNNRLRAALMDYSWITQTAMEAWRVVSGRQTAFLKPFFSAITHEPNREALPGTVQTRVVDYDFKKMIENPDFLTSLNAQLSVQSNQLLLQQQQLDEANKVLAILRESDD